MNQSKKHTTVKKVNQLKLEFPTNESLTKEKEVKIIQFNSREYIYNKILNRVMK